MGLFGNTPNINQKEFNEAIMRLRAGGRFGERRLDAIRQVFRGDLEEEGTYRGIDAKEFERAMKHLQENKYRYGLEDHHLEAIKEELGKKL